jgi:hypothetical protein
MSLFETQYAAEYPTIIDHSSDLCAQCSSLAQVKVKKAKVQFAKGEASHWDCSRSWSQEIIISIPHSLRFGLYEDPNRKPCSLCKFVYEHAKATLERSEGGEVDAVLWHHMEAVRVLQSGVGLPASNSATVPQQFVDVILTPISTPNGDALIHQNSLKEEFAVLKVDDDKQREFRCTIGPSLGSEDAARQYFPLITKTEGFLRLAATNGKHIPCKRTSWVNYLPKLGSNTSDTSRMVIGNPGSAQTFSTIRSWIDVCNRTHQHCNPNYGRWFNKDQPTILPKRVISISTLDGCCKAKLLTSVGSHGRYLTLSHCWGDSKWQGATKATMDALSENIDLGSIPKTFHDAIVATSKLEVPYLWIDTLCILQDDPDDWKEQSQKMGSIYANAYLNLSANVSPNSHSGIFVDRKLTTSVFQVNSDGLCITNQPEASWQTDVERSLLHSRGWVLQERLLSRRSLNFAANQVYWRCRNHIIAEDGTYFPVTDRNLTQAAVQFAERKLDYSRKGSNSLLFDIDHMWQDILQKYSRCNLSYSTDKIPALLGLGEVINKITGLTFFYGHWFDQSTEPPSSLIWCIGPDYSDSNLGKRRHPTWSCTSLDGVLGFQTCRVKFDFSLAEPHWFQKGSFVQPEPPSEEQGSSLKIRGRLRSGKRDPNFRSYAQWERTVPMYRDFQGSTYNVGRVFFDTPKRMPLEFACLAIYPTIATGTVNDIKTNMNVIILECVSQTNAPKIYERVGVGRYDDTRWVDQTEPIIIEII